MMVVTCPFCHATTTARMRPFGSRLLTEQWWCNACHSPFEWVPPRPQEKRHD